MNPVVILYALSIGCFAWAFGIFCYLVWDWLRVTRRMRDGQLDHWPIRGESRWNRRNRPNWIHKP